MRPDFASRIALGKLLSEYEPSEDIPNRDYYEEQMAHLKRMAATYRMQSIDPKVPARLRARARDLEQNTAGLINGIKFALALMEWKNSEPKSDIVYSD